MPLALNPNKKFALVLKSDQTGPESDRPSFHFRYLTGERWMEVADLSDRLEKAAGGRQGLGIMYDTLRVSLVGWSNMRTGDAELAKRFGVEPGRTDLPYKPELLESLIGPGEARELLDGMMDANRPTEAERKNSESQAPLSGAASASSAPPAAATTGPDLIRLPGLSAPPVTVQGVRPVTTVGTSP